MAYWSWIAEIRTPGEKKNAFKVSTGVPISQRYILTTGHGIPKEKNASIKIRFRKKNVWEKVTCVWHGLTEPEAIDAALLEMTRDENILPFVYSSYLPPDKCDWQGCGFPVVAEIKKEKDGKEIHIDSKGVGGTLFPYGNNAKGELDLEYTSGPNDPKRWAGLSGAPVMWQNKLVGIIKELTDEFDKRFNGIAIKRLLEIPSFQEKIEVIDQKDFTNATQRKVQEYLERSDDIVDALLVQNELDGCSRDTRIMAKKLMNMPIQSFVECMYSVLGSEWADKPKVREIIKNLLCLILPLLWDVGAICSIRSQMDIGAIISIPFATGTIAEIVMAGSAKRPVRFKQGVVSEEGPKGEFSLPFAEEIGPAIPIGDLIDVFDRHMIKEFTTEKYEERQVDNLRKTVNKRMIYITGKKWENRDHKYRFYFIYKKYQGLPNAVISRLKSYYPNLIFIQLTGTMEAKVDELSLCWPLADIFNAIGGHEK